MHSVARNLTLKLKNSQVYCDLLYQDSKSYAMLNTSSVPNSTDNTKFYIEAAFNVSVDKSYFTSCGASLYGGVFWLT